MRPIQVMHPAHKQLGLVYMALGEDRLAQQSFERALKIDPNDSDANNNYGMFLCRRKREKEAFKYFMAALKNPLYATPENAYANAGVCARMQGDDVKARGIAAQGLGAAAESAAGPVSACGNSVQARRSPGSAQPAGSSSAVVSNPSPEALWLGARIDASSVIATAVASYGTQLNNRYPERGADKGIQRGPVAVSEARQTGKFRRGRSGSGASAGGTPAPGI